MQNVNQRHQPQLLGLTAQQGQQVAAANNNAPMQGTGTEYIQQTVQDSYVSSRAKEMTADVNPLQQMALAVPVWYGMSQAMEHYAKHSRGDYEKSIQYKITNSGDRVANAFNESALGKSNFVAGVGKKVKSLKKFFREKVINKSAMLRAFSDTPSKAELAMVIGQQNGMYGMQLFDYPQMTEKFMEPLKYVEDLDCYGADQKFISKVKSDWTKAVTKEAKAKVLENAEFEILAKGKGLSLDSFKSLVPEDKVKMLQELKAQALGYNSFDHLQTVTKNAQDHLADIIEACHKTDPKMHAKIWTTDHSAAGKVKGHLIGRKVYASEFQNKLLAEMGKVEPGSAMEAMLKRTGLEKHIPKSGLGRAMGKYVNLIGEGLTNGVAGGKLAILIQAFYMADAIIKTSRAEKGDKFPTFMERLVEMVAFFAAMPLAIQLMHRIGGLQYAGMTPEQVAKYRKDLNIFNDKAAKGLFKNKTIYDAEKLKLKNTLKAGKQNIFTRFAKKIGSMVTVGLEQIRPYSKTPVQGGFIGTLKDIPKNPKYWLKQGLGYPVRIILGMMMILPFLSKLLVKGSHLIFGKPKNSILDEGKEDKTKKDKNAQPTPQEQLQQIQQLEMMVQQAKASGQLTPEQQAQIQQLEVAIAQAKAELAKQNPEMQQQLQSEQQVQQPVQNSAEVPLNNPNNLLDKYKNLQPSNKLNEPVRTYIPSPEPVKILNPERNYIPSSAPAQITNNIDTTEADKAMMRADSAEKLAMQTLAMK